MTWNQSCVTLAWDIAGQVTVGRAAERRRHSVFVADGAPVLRVERPFGPFVADAAFMQQPAKLFRKTWR
jgi:hypothetical protein